jgi:tetratricopeptide (TPR) repeat protein
MAEKPQPNNPNNIEMNVTAHGDSKVTMVGQLNAAEVKLIVENIEPILERLQQIPQVESPGVLKVGSPGKSLAYWQGRKTEIAREIGDRYTQSLSLMNLGVAYSSLREYQQAINFYQQSLEIAREIGDRNTQGLSLTNLGNTYLNLGQYQEAIEFCQQSLEISREIGDIRGEAFSWFNLGLALENVNRESDALGAYRNARELFQTMGLDANVQDCNNAIKRLSQPKMPVVSRRGFWVWLRRLWRWVCSLFRQ